MNNKKDSQTGGNGQMDLVFVGLLFFLAMLSKLWPKTVEFMKLHEVTIKLLIIFFMFFVMALIGIKMWNWYAKGSHENSITEADETSVFLGVDTVTNREVHLKQAFRTMHMQVIGTTNAGKTESVVLPLAIQDIKNGSGVLIVDGKSDSSFVNKLYAYVKLYNREKDFRLFSLANPAPSSSFNPLKGRSAQEVTERVFSSFTFENEYYKNIQYKLFLNIVRLIFAQNEIPTFSLVQRLLVDVEELERWVEHCPDDMLKRDMVSFLLLSVRDREERVSGLETMLSHFTCSEISVLFEETDHSIDFDEALANGQIIYFQLPTMYFPFLAAATGKLVLQCFQNAVSKRQIFLGVKENGKVEVLFSHS